MPPARKVQPNLGSAHNQLEPFRPKLARLPPLLPALLILLAALLLNGVALAYSSPASSQAGEPHSATPSIKIRSPQASGTWTVEPVQGQPDAKHVQTSKPVESWLQGDQPRHPQTQMRLDSPKAWPALSNDALASSRDIELDANIEMRPLDQMARPALLVAAGEPHLGAIMQASPLPSGFDNQQQEEPSSSDGSIQLTNQNQLTNANVPDKNNETSPPDDPYVTCPPDYEDQVGALDPAANMTEEQHLHYLDALIAPNGSNPGLGWDDPTGLHQQRPPFPCVSPGSRMIETITKVITPILFSIIIVVGLLGNIIVMIVILEDRKTDRELTPTGLLILDLSLADLSFIILCIPFTGLDYSLGHWIFGSLWCKFNQYLIVVSALSSIYTLVLMSIDRFMAIVYPIQCISYRTSKNTLYAIYIKWICILLLASPAIKMHGLVKSGLSPELHDCRFLAEQYNPLHFQIIFFITSYLFPLIFIFCLYLSLLNKLWFGAKPHGHKESLKMQESKKKVTWLVAGIVVVFALCWCPIQVMLILMRLKTHSYTATYVAIQVFAHTLGYMNSCVNPIVYAFASETFHNSFKRSSVGRCCYMLFCLSNNQHQPQQHHSQQQHQQQYQTHLDQSRSSTFRPTQNHTTTLIDFSPHFQNHQQYQGKRSSNHEPNALTSTDVNGGHGDSDKDLHVVIGTISNDNHIDTSSSTLLTSTHHGKNEMMVFSANNNCDAGKINTLPLEPRDRQLQFNSGSKVNGQLDRRGQHSQQNSSNNHPDSVSSSQTSAKQQLVAHMVPSGNQISHRCEPITQPKLDNS